MTLRTRLLLTIAAISTILCLLIGAVAVIALNQIALKSIDQQLQNATKRGEVSGKSFKDFKPGQGSEPGRGPDACVASAPAELGQYLCGPAQTVGTLAAQVTKTASGTSVTAAVLRDSSSFSSTVVALPDSAAQALTSVDAGHEVSVHLDGVGDYRVKAVTAQNASGTVTLMGLPLDDVQRQSNNLTRVLAFAIPAGLIIMLLIGSALLRVALSPLERIRATLTRVSEQPLDRGEVALAERVPDADPRTEVGQVATSLNRMLEHIADALNARQASETRLRRFASDASHELRTPLASIRGYAELMRRRPEPLPDDVAHALGRVESEATRMGGLVEDMLMLARLDEGRELEHDLVDLRQIVTDATGDARVAGPNHVWRTHLPTEDVLALGDTARLTQVVVNLLANARTHTPAGTTVDVTLSLVPTTTKDSFNAVLEIADNGPGVPKELVAEAFERFTRGDSSRSRAAGSTGLGLSIVDAVTRAHGGSARLESVEGQGTRVIITLPAVSLDDSDDDFDALSADESTAAHR